MKPTIDIISLGGTIAMKADGIVPGAVPTLTADDLIAVVPQLSDIADIRAQTFRNIPGAHLTFDDLDALAIEIRERSRNGGDGIVITQGTDTIEETAYVMDLLLGLDIPVVVTGAMRNPSRPGADGPANLLSAVQVAVSPKARSLGALVVFNDEIHAARFVRKSHTSNPATFRSDPLGPIGWLAEDQVRILLKPERLAPVKKTVSAGTVGTVKVPIIKLGLGDDETMIEAAVSAGVDGLIVEALGGGHVPICIADALQRAAKHLPVILSSRTGQGEALSCTYGFAGSEIDLLRRGLISGGQFDGCHARILLCVLLRNTQTHRDEIVREFLLRGRT